MYNIVVRKSCTLQNGSPQCFKHPLGDMHRYDDIFDSILCAVIHITETFLDLQKAQSLSEQTDRTSANIAL